jgi:hypothetical protein
VTNTEIRKNQHEGHRGSISGQVEMGRPCGKNGPEQVDKHCVTVVCKNGWTTGRLKTLCADTFKEVTGGQ